MILKIPLLYGPVNFYCSVYRQNIREYNAKTLYTDEQLEPLKNLFEEIGIDAALSTGTFRIYIQFKTNEDEYKALFHFGEL